MLQGKGKGNTIYLKQLKRHKRKEKIPTSLKVRDLYIYIYIYTILSNKHLTFSLKKVTTSANAATAVPPRSVIETHGMSTQGQRLPSAMELSLHKVQRERQMAQALIEQRQISTHPNTQPMFLVNYIRTRNVALSNFFPIRVIQCLNQPFLRLK